jgi:hypothetical protein
MSNRRRTEVVTRKAQLTDLKSERFTEIARLVTEALEPHIEALVEAKVAKAMADLAARQHRAAQHQEDQQCARPQS